MGVGPVSQSDVQLAVPLGAKILGFNVRPAGADVEALAKQHEVEVGPCCCCCADGPAARPPVPSTVRVATNCEVCGAAWGMALGCLPA